MTKNKDFYSILTFHNTVYPEWYDEEEGENKKYFGVLTLHGQVDPPPLIVHLFNGKIYDWQNRQWVQALELGNTVEKFYYVQSETPQEVNGYVHGYDFRGLIKMMDTISLLPDLVDEHGEIELIDHTVHMMQQRVRSAE